MDDAKIIEIALSLHINMFGPRILTEVYDENGVVTHLKYVSPAEPHYAGKEIIEFAKLIEKEVLKNE